MEKYQKIITYAFIAVAFISTVMFAWYVTSSYFNMKQSQLRYEAIDGCLNGSQFKFENKETGTTTTEPMKDAFERCMKEKGLR